MIRYILAVSASLFLATSCDIDDKYYGPENMDVEHLLQPAYAEDWTKNADQLNEVLLNRFLDRDQGLFFATNDNRLPDRNRVNYWPQAHAMDVLIDAYLRLGAQDPRKKEFEDIMDRWYANKAGNYDEQNKGTYGFGNAFTDDSEWVILTLIRMYEATGRQEYLRAAASTYEESIITRWSDDENGGGIRWSLNAENSKNACSNAPAIIIAMRLRAHTSNVEMQEKLLDDARKIYNWLSSTLYNPQTGGVADLMKDGQVQGGTLTYNQGTFIGAAHELYKVTKDEKYLTEAIKALRYTFRNKTANGILHNEGSGDNALFKGIFVRYAMNLWQDKSLDAVASGIRKEIEQFLIYNGLICWTKGLDLSDNSNYFFGASWTEHGSSWEGLLNEQVCGSTMIEAMTQLIP